MSFGGEVLPQATEVIRLVEASATGSVHDEITERINKYSKPFHMMYPTLQEKHINRT